MRAWMSGTLRMERGSRTVPVQVTPRVTTTFRAAELRGYERDEAFVKGACTLQYLSIQHKGPIYSISVKDHKKLWEADKSHKAYSHSKNYNCMSICDTSPGLHR
ncbi:uncharacterized protein LOC135098419 [Scylla paramamosain]|uniref:uncharacterized protein LOC135098419 n=1 Tax=Scylla paramamosain TaxID=85552 RepID=UPI0030834AF1